jgi:hypothetical protein
VALSKGETRALIMVAAPRALGMLRDVYSPAVRKAIRAELGKDLVRKSLMVKAANAAREIETIKANGGDIGVLGKDRLREYDDLARNPFVHAQAERRERPLRMGERL